MRNKHELLRHANMCTYVVEYYQVENTYIAIYVLVVELNIISAPAYNIRMLGLVWVFVYIHVNIVPLHTAYETSQRVW